MSMNYPLLVFYFELKKWVLVIVSDIFSVIFRNKIIIITKIA